MSTLCLCLCLWLFPCAYCHSFSPFFPLVLHNQCSGCYSEFCCMEDYCCIHCIVYIVYCILYSFCTLHWPWESYGNVYVLITLFILLFHSSIICTNPQSRRTIGALGCTITEEFSVCCHCIH